MEYTDTRVRYTKAVLQQALLEILRVKNIDRVTIKELCEQARVNRGTFYLHYTTPNDVLKEIEQLFIDENMLQFDRYCEEYEISYMYRLFTGILKNKDLCRIIMGQNGNPRFVEKIREMVRGDVINRWSVEFPQYDRADLDYVYDFVFAGSMRLILRWIDEEGALSTETLASMLDRLGHYCHLAILEFRRT